jgi:hypothetical protein
MGRIIILTLVLIMLLLKKSYGTTFRGNDSLSLQISGKISFKKKTGDNTYKVELIRNNRVIDSQTVKGKHSFTFKLSKNEYYGVRITKQGYIQKLVSVCTDMNDSDKHSHHFHFETSLVSEDELSKFNKDMLDFPIAVISFNEKKESFSYSRKYTTDIKRKMLENDLS